MIIENQNQARDFPSPLVFTSLNLFHKATILSPGHWDRGVLIKSKHKCPRPLNIWSTLRHYNFFIFFLLFSWVCLSTIVSSITGYWPQKALSHWADEYQRYRKDVVTIKFYNPNQSCICVHFYAIFIICVDSNDQISIQFYT